MIARPQPPLTTKRMERRVAARDRLQRWLIKQSRTPRKCLRLRWADISNIEATALIRRRLRSGNPILIATLFTPYVDPARRDHETDDDQ
jgi:hypothetical protein